MQYQFSLTTFFHFVYINVYVWLSECVRVHMRVSEWHHSMYVCEDIDTDMDDWQTGKKNKSDKIKFVKTSMTAIGRGW